MRPVNLLLALHLARGARGWGWGASTGGAEEAPLPQWTGNETSESLCPEVTDAASLARYGYDLAFDFSRMRVYVCEPRGQGLGGTLLVDGLVDPEEADRKAESQEEVLLDMFSHKGSLQDELGPPQDQKQERTRFLNPWKRTPGTGRCFGAHRAHSPGHSPADRNCE